MAGIGDDVAKQPSDWREAAKRARGVGFLPERGTKVAAIGCGSSYYMAQSFAMTREATGAGESDAFPASEMPRSRKYDYLVVISRTGTTREVLEAVDHLTWPIPTITISAKPGTPLEKLSQRAIVLEFAKETARVQTRFATSALALLKAHLGEDIEATATAAEQAVREPLGFDPAAYDHYVFLGSGSTVGLANYAGLLIQEVAGVWGEAYPAMEYRHGPISTAGPKTVVWPLGPVLRELADDVATTGARVIGRNADPMAEIVRVQRTAAALAEARGRRPDFPEELRGIVAHLHTDA